MPAEEIADIKAVERPDRRIERRRIPAVGHGDVRARAGEVADDARAALVLSQADQQGALAA
jgi:hypothetical protein